MRNKSVSNQVLSTSRYGTFRLLDTNRDINLNHVRSLVRSMEENGNITQVSPILVNGRNEVIDGQHRLEACRELGLPVHYRTLEGLSIDEARTMNVVHRTWTGPDYLESFVKENRRSYVDLKTLWEEYPDVSLSVLVIFAKGMQYKGYNAEFLKGEMEMFDIDAARERLDKLAALKEVSEAFGAKPMAAALIAILRNPNYDHERMLRKVRTHSADIHTYQNVRDNLRQLEDVYNVGYGDENRVRFF